MSLKINHAAGRTHTVLRRKAWLSPEFTLLPSGGGWVVGWGVVQCKSMRENSKHFVFLERKILTKKILIKEKEPPEILFYTKASALHDMESERRLGTY